VTRDLHADLGSRGVKEGSPPTQRGCLGARCVRVQAQRKVLELCTPVIQAANRLGTNRGPPDIPERVAEAKRTQVIGSQVCFGVLRLDPGVDARTSAETELRVYA